MKFDYTHGKKAKYMVSFHTELIGDQYYFSDFHNANEMFKRMANEEREKGTAVSLYDMATDTRKKYHKY